jgi:hypothetical protein
MKECVHTCEGTSGGPTGTAVVLTGLKASPVVGVTVPAVIESVEDEGDCGLRGMRGSGAKTPSVTAGRFTFPDPEVIAGCSELAMSLAVALRHPVQVLSVGPGPTFFPAGRGV